MDTYKVVILCVNLAYTVYLSYYIIIHVCLYDGYSLYTYHMWKYTYIKMYYMQLMRMCNIKLNIGY